jgi:O-antigen ligase
LLWLIWQFGTTKERLRSLLKAYVYGGTILAVAVIANRVLGYASVVIKGLDIPLRYSAFGMNANDLAIVLVFSAAMSCYLGAREQSTWGIWLFRLHLGLAGLGVLVTGSRGALLAGFCVIVFVPFAFWHLPPRRRMAEIAVRLGLFCTVPFFVPTHTARRVVTIAKDEIRVGNPSRRVTIWAAALALFREKPLHGVGIGAFRAVSKPYLGRAIDTHNGMLSALLETGIVGLLLFSTFIAILVRQGFRLNQTDRRFWLCLFGVWLIGCSLLPWDDKKANWFTVGVAAAWMAAPVSTTCVESAGDRSDSREISSD